jgi:hypothetical protein
MVFRSQAPVSPVTCIRLRVALYTKRREPSVCLPNARRSKYSTTPTAACAVQDPRVFWFSIAEHQVLRSTAAGSAGAAFMPFSLLVSPSASAMSAISGSCTV